MFYHIYMEYNLHDVLRKLKLVIKKTKKCQKWMFGYDLKLLSFYKIEHYIC
jgi:hypothetical protein